MGLWIIIVAAIIGVCSVFITKTPNNPVEEAAEDVIQMETGVKVDLTPKSYESKKTKN